MPGPVMERPTGLSNSSDELNTGAGDRMRDHLVVIGLALDDRADHHDAVDFLALQQRFHDRRHVVNAGDADDARDLDAERFGMLARPLLPSASVTSELNSETTNAIFIFQSSSPGRSLTASRISTPLLLRYDFSAGIGCSP